MAEAHAAVAFSFRVTPEGVDVKLNHEALRQVWHSGLHSWHLRLVRFKNHCINTLYPAPPFSLFLMVALVMGLQLYSGIDWSYGFIDFAASFFPECVHEQCELLAALFFGIFVWIVYVLAWRYTLKLLLLNHSWMYCEHGKMDIMNKIWVGLVQLLRGKKPLLYSYQAALPKQPVPPLQQTKRNYLNSVRPLMNDSEYERMARLADEFFSTIGPKLQRYLILKSWWATNYVTDWWEEYVYLRGRSPIMVNSNYYGLDAIYVRPTHRQAARAANMVYVFLQYKRTIEVESMEPLLVNKTVPLDSQQYERMFNLTRIPGIESDILQHSPGINYIAVLHRGRWFKVATHEHRQLLSPRQLESIFQAIIEDDSEPAPGELHLAALTAGERVAWAKARKEYFSTGINKASLSAIEKASFVLSLDDEPYDFAVDKSEELNSYAEAMLFGKCYNRWFDKSFTLIVSSNGRVGFNAEHSWADAPILSQVWEAAFAYDFDDRADSPMIAQVWEVYVAEDLEHIGYNEDGHCRGPIPDRQIRPIRLSWDIPSECRDVIESSLRVAQTIAVDVDLHILVHNMFGKGSIKKCKISPDAFIQMALQLAYYRSANKFCLTYEASMTRLFREGRTETVRSCTVASSQFVLAMCDKNVERTEVKKLLMKACSVHQDGYRDAMSGKGIDRHLFCLYVVSKYLAIDSPFLKEVLSEPWRLSTSQTPHSQLGLIQLDKHPDHVCTGGGFGPVSDDGYGVSYIIAGENMIFFHVSSKKSCPTTNSKEFANLIQQSMADIKDLCLL